MTIYQSNIYGLRVQLKGLVIEQLRDMDVIPPKGQANIKGDKWQEFVKKARKLGKIK